MSVLHKYELVENKFSKFSFKVKVELFLLPLLLILFYFFVLEDEASEYIPPLKTIDYSNIKMEDTFFDIQNSVENFCSLSNINLESISFSKNILSLKAHTTFSKVKKLIHYLDFMNNFSNITSFEIFKYKKKFIVLIDISFEKFHLKQNIEEKSDISPKLQKLKLKAVIDNNVLINNTWLSHGEKIDGYVIKKIDKNEVLLEKEGKTKKLKVFKNELFIK